jgi:hypothetical protein
MNAETLGVLGIALTVVGAIFNFLPRMTIFGIPQFGQQMTKVREQMILDAEKQGDFRRAEKLKRERFAIERRLPVYAKILIALGVLLIIAASVIYLM